jgi:hypothetical protein
LRARRYRIGRQRTSVLVDRGRIYGDSDGGANVGNGDHSFSLEVQLEPVRFQASLDSDVELTSRGGVPELPR